MFFTKISNQNSPWWVANIFLVALLTASLFSKKKTQTPDLKIETNCLSPDTSELLINGLHNTPKSIRLVKLSLNKNYIVVTYKDKKDASLKWIQWWSTHGTVEEIKKDLSMQSITLTLRKNNA